MADLLRTTPGESTTKDGGELRVGDMIYVGPKKDRITKLTPYPMPSKVFEPGEASIAEFELSHPMTIEHNLPYEVPNAD